MKEEEKRKVVQEIIQTADELYDYASDTLKKIYNITSRLAGSERVSLEKMNIMFLTYLRILVDTYHDFVGETCRESLDKEAKTILFEVLMEAGRTRDNIG